MRKALDESAFATGYGLCMALRYVAPSRSGRCRSASCGACWDPTPRLATGSAWPFAASLPANFIAVGSAPYPRQRCGPAGPTKSRRGHLRQPIPTAPPDFQMDSTFHAFRRNRRQLPWRCCGGLEILPQLHGLDLSYSEGVVTRRGGQKASAILPTGPKAPSVEAKWASPPPVLYGRAAVVSSNNRRPCTGRRTLLYLGFAQYHVRETDSWPHESLALIGRAVTVLREVTRYGRYPHAAASGSSPSAEQTVAPAVRQGEMCLLSATLSAIARQRLDFTGLAMSAICQQCVSGCQRRLTPRNVDRS